MHICKRTTSKMSHYSTIILVVRPRWGRSHVDALTPQVKTWALSPLRYESGKAERCTCDPVGVLQRRVLVPSAILFPKILIRFCEISRRRRLMKNRVDTCDTLTFLACFSGDFVFFVLVWQLGATREISANTLPQTSGDS